MCIRDSHLDIASKEILEEALNSYTGTVFYVSHDRYFINQTATRILDCLLYTSLCIPKICIQLFFHILQISKPVNDQTVIFLCADRRCV